jgi:hypothetical protein
LFPLLLIKLRLKNYFLIMFFHSHFVKENKHAWLKNKNSFKRRWNIKRLYWNTRRERWSETFYFFSISQTAVGIFFFFACFFWINATLVEFSIFFGFNWWKVYFLGHLFAFFDVFFRRETLDTLNGTMCKLCIKFEPSLTTSSVLFSRCIEVS